MFLPGKFIFAFRLNYNRVLLDHEWYEKSSLLMLNNRTFLKGWERMNMTEVSLVCFKYIQSVNPYSVIY